MFIKQNFIYFFNCKANKIKTRFLKKIKQTLIIIKTG